MFIMDIMKLLSGLLGSFSYFVIYLTCASQITKGGRTKNTSCYSYMKRDYVSAVAIIVFALCFILK